VKRPFDPAQLPPELRAAIDQGLHLTAALELHDAAAEAEAPQLGHLLAAEGYCVFEEGLEFMVHEVVERGHRALELFKRARKAGLPAELVKAYRSKVQRLVKKEEAREAKVMALLGQDPETLDLDSVKSLAYLLDDRDGARNRALSAPLWSLLAERQPKPVDAGFARCRLGLALWHAGQREQARPLLEAMVRQEFETYDAEGSMLLAGYCILEEALERDDPDEILTTWRRLDQAVRARSPERLFPYAIKLRIRVRGIARRLGLSEIVERLTT